VKAGTDGRSNANVSKLEATAKGSHFGSLARKSAGYQWTFTNSIFTSASFSPGQDALIKFQFDSMTGNAAAFEALGNK
jgi:hypothetical protein